MATGLRERAWGSRGSAVVADRPPAEGAGAPPAGQGWNLGGRAGSRAVVDGGRCGKETGAAGRGRLPVAAVGSGGA
nr:unnamed protein product [Digitaria exilis]